MANACNADSWFAGFILSCMGSTLLLTTCIIQCVAERIARIDVREQRINVKDKVNTASLEELIVVESETSIRQRRIDSSLDF